MYDKAAIQVYWDKQGGALQKRWGEFLGLSVPFLTRVASMSITGGAAELTKNDRTLARGRACPLLPSSPRHLNLAVCSQCTGAPVHIRRIHAASMGHRHIMSIQ